MWLLVFCWFLMGLPSVSGQELPKPQGRFLEDSSRLGDSVRFALWFRHPKEMEVVFPDSSVIPAHFELLSKRYFPTKTKKDLSLDSAVYVLRSFELAPYLSLRLPVFILANGDSTVLYSDADSVGVQELVKEVTEPLVLLQNNQPRPLPQQFNYLYLLVGLALGLLVVMLLLLFFGKSIKRWYQRYMATTKFRAFQSRFNGLIRRFERYQSVQVLEEAVTLWKNYLTDLEEVPINSFTTKEIAEYYEQDELGEVLKLCDRAIYGNIIENQEQKTNAALRYLGHFSVVRYDQLQNLPADALRATA